MAGSGTVGPNAGAMWGWLDHETGWGQGFNVNGALLDAILGCEVIDQTHTAPPGSPVAGDRYIPLASATGAFAGQEKKVAVYSGTSWAFFTPKSGWRLRDANLDAFYVFDGTDWVAESAGATVTVGASRLFGNSGTVSGAGGDIVVGAGLSLSVGGTLATNGLAPTASPTFTGTVTLPAVTGGAGVVDLTASTAVRVPAPAVGADATTKTYVDSLLASSVSVGAGKLFGNAGTVSAGGGDITVGAGLSLSATGTLIVGGAGLVDLTGSAGVRVPTPSGTTDAATKAYVDAVIQGLTPKPTATVATTANVTATYANGTAGVGATLTVTATGVHTVDGHAVALNEIVLYKDQTSAFQNGLYLCTTAGAVGVSAVYTRIVGMDTTGEFSGAFVPVENVGSANANTLWLANPVGTVTVGTTNIPFTQLNPPGATAAGTGIAVSGTTVSLASASNLTLKSNVSGGAAVPTDNTLTAILDAILGSNQGAIIVRGASTWGTIVPGAAGQVLLSNGTSVAATFQSQTIVVPASWKGVDPNNVVIHEFRQTGTIVEIIGNPEVLNGAAFTAQLLKAGNGTAIASGVSLTTNTFNCNTLVTSNQTLTLTGTSANLVGAIGDRVGLATVGTAGTAMVAGMFLKIVTP